MLLDTGVDSVPSHIELLTTLQRLDQGISGKKRDVDNAVRQLQMLQEAVEQRQAEAERLRAELAELKVQQNGIERELAETSDKMKDRRMRMQRIRNEKEMQATQREIEGMKERVTQLEEQELQIMEQAETLTPQVAAAEENLRGGQEALETERAELVARESALTQEISQDTKARHELAAGLDDNLRRRYETIFARHGGTAVVGVREGACQGCHMHVRPQLYNQILKGEQVFQCPSCHRILFSPPEEDNDGR
jgi:predicted  nucleic acid-binding Zn-ribbon protein